MATAAMLKNRKIAISWPMSTKFGTLTQLDPFSAVRPLQFSKKKLKISLHHSGDCHLEKSKYRHISATVGPIATKFGTLTQFDPLNYSVSKIGPQLVALFDWFMRLMSRIHFQNHSVYRMTR